MVDAAVTDVGYCAASLMEAEERQRGTHFLLAGIVLRIDGGVGSSECLFEELVFEYSVGRQTTENVVTHGLAHRSAGYLARLVTTHAVAENKETVGCGCCIQNRKNGVFLIRTATQLVDSLWL